MYFLEFMNLPLQYLQEVYFGKSDTLLEMEKQIGIIRESFKSTKDMTSHPATQAFNRLMEKQFGMELFALHIESSVQLNAYTIPIAKRFDVVLEDDFKNLVEMNSKTGYKFKQNNGLCIMTAIYSGLLMNQDFSNAEILAILLHEIGHNFADAIHDKLRVYNAEIMQNFLDYFILLILIDPIHALTYIKFRKTNNNEYQKKIEENRKPKNLKAFINYTKSKIQDIGQKIDAFIFRITGGISFRIRKLAMVARINTDENQYNKQNEIIADKFATINGYGPELQTALIKLGNINPVKDFVEKIPFIGSMMNLSTEKALADIFKFDEHPQIIQRIKSSISALEFELKKTDLDPKVKEVIENQIDQLNKLLVAITEISKDATKADQFKANYNKYVLNNYEFAISEKIEEDINSMLDNFGSK